MHSDFAAHSVVKADITLSQHTLNMQPVLLQMAEVTEIIRQVNGTIGCTQPEIATFKINPLYLSAIEPYSRIRLTGLIIISHHLITNDGANK